MLRSMVGIARVLCLVGVQWIAANGRVAAAVVVGFENPPFIAGGTVVGQDGWVSNVYVGPGQFLEFNGDVDVSATSPLTGSQSLLYNETSFAGGNGGGRDISKANVISVVKDGTTRVDLAATVLMQVDANVIRNGQVGVFLSFDGLNGFSPIGVLLNDANSVGGTGRIMPLDSSGFVDSGAYVANNVIEFQFGVNFDNLNYELAYRDVTAGGPVTPLIGSGPGGRFLFFGGAFPDDGDGQTFTVDIGIPLRGGVGRLDEITLTAVPEPTALVLGVIVLSAGLLRRSRR